VKRFLIETATLDKRFSFISESAGSKLLFADSRSGLVVEFVVGKGKKAQSSMVSLSEFIDVKGWKAVGNRLASDLPVSIRLVSFSMPDESTLAGSALVGDGDVVNLEDGGSLASVGVGRRDLDKAESPAGAGVEEGDVDEAELPAGAASIDDSSRSGVHNPTDGAAEAEAGQDSGDRNRQGVPRQLGLFD